ncbi:MAG: hypothetical protein OCC46_12925 [Pseudodesulfovibrio sp.]
MPYSVVTTHKQDHLLHVTDGNVQSADEFFEWALAVVTKALEVGQTKLLCDNRTFSLQISQFDVIECLKRLEEMEAPKFGLRFAVLSSREHPEISRFVETSFTNRSASYKRFGNQKDALEWLLA